MNKDQLSFAIKHFNELQPSNGMFLKDLKPFGMRPYVERIQRRRNGKMVSLYCLTEENIQYVQENMNFNDDSAEERFEQEMNPEDYLVKLGSNDYSVPNSSSSTLLEYSSMNNEPKNKLVTHLVSNVVDDTLDIPKTLKDIGFERRNEEIVFNYKDISKLEYLLHLSPNNLCPRGPSEHQGCYLIQLAVDKGTDKYKIGRSGNLLKRLNSTEYRNAYIYSVMYVNDEKECEKKLITTFKTKFIIVNQSVDGGYGRELFRGNIIEMIKEFTNICLEYVH